MKKSYCSSAWIGRCCNTGCESHMGKDDKPEGKAIILLNKEIKDCGFVKCKSSDTVSDQLDT